MRRSPGIGQSELEILQYIHDHHPITVREVAEHFAQATGHARTTILTVMDRLREKGYLTRRKDSGAYRYSPSIPKDKMLRTLVQNFVENALKGSVSPFVAYLADAENVTDEELEELKQLVQDLESQRKENIL